MQCGMHIERLLAKEHLPMKYFLTLSFLLLFQALIAKFPMVHAPVPELYDPVVTVELTKV